MECATCKRETGDIYCTDGLLVWCVPCGRRRRKLLERSATCKWCGDPVPANRRKFCCATCQRKAAYDIWRQRNGPHLRAYQAEYRKQRRAAEAAQ